MNGHDKVQTHRRVLGVNANEIAVACIKGEFIRARPILIGRIIKRSVGIKIQLTVLRLVEWVRQRQERILGPCRCERIRGIYSVQEHTRGCEMDQPGASYFGL